MEPAVAAAVLAASLLHATWHALVKSSEDGVTALAGMNIVSGAAAMMLIPFVRLPTPVAAAVIGGSVFLHAAYKVGLARLYSRADLSVGYPLARGLTPIMATAFALLLLGEKPDLRTLGGVLVISLGIAALVLERGVPRLSLATLLAAAVAGMSVAAYSAVDAYGVRVNGDWLGFTAWLVACDSGVFVLYAVASRGAKATDAWRRAWGRTLISGLLGVASFAVFMWALSRAQVGAVAALRETSIIFAAILGATFLKERMTRVRYICAAMVMSGTVAIALGRL